jgi:hypothetical protein
MQRSKIDAALRSPEFKRWEAADALATAVVTLYGAVKATEARQPGFVNLCLRPLEIALQNWCEARDESPSEQEPAIESTRGK